MAEAILTRYQRAIGLNSRYLLHPWTDITNRKPDASIVCLVCRRCMKYSPMMQCDLTRCEDHIDSFSFIDVDSYFLTA